MTRTRQGLLATLAASALVLAGGGVPSAAAAPAGDGPRSTYVVVLHDGVDPRSAGRGLADRYGGQLGHVYEHALRGFSVTVPENALQGISRDPRVRYVERDQVFRTTAASPEVPTGVERTYADDNGNLAIDDSANERVNVDIAIIDTGLDSDHPDLNIAGGTNCSGGGPFSSKCTDGTYEDGNGHGTHVGGSAAAKDDGAGVVGMAPGARLWGVKVLGDNGSGYTSWIIAGIDWVTGKADTIEVANMSLGCECFSQAQDDAITRSVAAGVTYAVAAGNSDKDASTFSPANHPDVITVSALADFNGLNFVEGGVGTPTCRTDQDDTLADFSNFGADVEIAAPGVCIRSTWPGGGYNTISGTSMASPHVAGAAALLASTRSTGSKADTAAIQKALVDAGNLDWTDDSGDGIRERLLDVHDTTVFAPAMLTDDGGTGTNAAPTASFSYSCSSLTCTFNAGASTDDVGITSYAWDFGDTRTGSGVTVEHTYGSASSYTVTLTVSDGSLSDSEVKTVTVSSSSITLSATAYKVKGFQTTDLTWSGATTTIDVYRNDKTVVTGTANDGAYTDNIGKKGGGSYTYKVCETGTLTCSPGVTVTF